jgi:hypothetical protein
MLIELTPCFWNTKWSGLLVIVTLVAKILKYLLIYFIFVLTFVNSPENWNLLINECRYLSFIEFKVLLCYIYIYIYIYIYNVVNIQGSCENYIRIATSMDLWTCD